MQFNEVMSSLIETPWFKKEKWKYSIHDYPPGKPEGVTLQVFKPGWLNDDGQGIHFESYLWLDERKRKKTYLTLHLLHHKRIPGTALPRIKLSKPFVDAVYSEVKTWKGYQFRTGKYGTQPFTLFLDGTDDDFAQDVSKELSRLCRSLGAQLDKTLRLVLS
jgi:hypothetical protein